jgi:sulfonate transport system substrate-binding protein
MKTIRHLALACTAVLIAAPAHAQAVKIKQGMLNVPALSPLYLLPDEAKKHGIEIEMVMFQRFADARTALASGDIQITAFGPQDISLGLGAGAKSMVGVA